MKKGHKFISIALVTLLLSSSLAGCVNKTDESSSSSADSSSKTESSSETVKEGSKFTPDPDEKYKISIVSNLFGPVDEDGFMLKQWEEKFNVDLDMWYIDSTKFDEVFNLKLASNEIPDVIQARGISQFNKYYEQQVLAEVPMDAVEEFMPNLKSKLETESPGVFKLGVIEGKQYGIPAEIRLHNKYRAPIVFRGDWLQNVGITKTPETLDEFEEAFYKFANEDPDGNGKKDTYGLSKSGLPAIYGAFGFIPGLDSRMNWSNVDGQLVYTSIQPEIKEGLALLNKWYKDGVLDPEFITGENKGGYWALSHAFIESKIGYTGHGAYYHWCSPTVFAAGQDYIELEKINPQAAESLVFAQPPVGKNGASMTQADNVFTGGMVTFGAHMADEPQKLGKFLEIQEYIAGDTPERYLEFYYGKEGEMWEYDADQVPQPMGIYIDPKEMAKVGAHYGLVMFSTMEAHGLINKKSSAWAEERGFDLGGKATDLMVALPSESKYLTELKKIENETFIEIITGAKPVDYFDEFVAKWKEIGGDQLIKEANEWYDTIK